MQKVKIEVNKKVNGKYEKVGEVDIYVPVLNTVFEGVEIAKDKEDKEIFEEGLPVYKDDKHNWIQGAMLAAVKAQARNKLVPGTGALKPNASIATDWVSLTAEGERGIGNPEALAAVREAKADFAEWVKTLGKSSAAQTTLNTLFGNKQALSLQSTDNKTKMEKYVSDFAESLEPAKLERYTKYLESVLSAAGTTAEVDDF